MMTTDKMASLGAHTTPLLDGMDMNDTFHRTGALTLLVLAVYCVIVLINYISNSASRKFWASHPWAGVLGKHVFPKTRAGIEAIRHTREIVENCYQQVRTSKLHRR